MDQAQNTLTKAGPSQQQVQEYSAAMERSLQVVEIQTDQGPVKLTPAIVRRYIAIGQVDRITDSDITLFMAMCKFNALNPFLREAWLIKYGETAQMVVSKDVFIKRAYENPDCEGWQAGIIVWDPEQKKYYDTRGLIPPGTELIGAWCEIEVKGRPQMRLEVNLAEYIQYTRDGRPTQQWSSGQNKGKQATMIRKVAIVQAIREAIPSKFKRMYIPDEMGLDSDKLSDEPIDIDPVQRETSGNGGNGGSVPAPDPEKQAEADGPKGDLPRRSRRNKFTGLSKDVFPSGKVETCGVKPEQLITLKRLVDGSEENRKFMAQFLAAYIGYDHPAYLREDEADALLRGLKPVAETKAGEEVFEPDAGQQDAQGPVVNDTVPGEPAPKTNGEKLVTCPYSPGEPVYMSHCLNECRTRAQDGFCLSIGEKPPRSGMLGGAA